MTWRQCWLTTVLNLAAGHLCAQLPTDRLPRLELRISTSFSQQETNARVLSEYLKAGREVMLTTRLSESLQAQLRGLFAQAAYNSVIIRESSDTLSNTATPDARYHLHCTIWMDPTTKLQVRLRLTSMDSAVAQQEWDLKPAVIPDQQTFDSLPNYAAGDRRAQREIWKLADQAAGAIGAEVYSALAKATLRLRVRVKSLDTIEAWPGFRSFLVRAVEGELARSAAIFVLRAKGAPEDLASNLGAAYDVEVGHQVIGGRIRIDVRCLKTGQVGRLLINRYIIADSSDMDSLSRALSDEVHRIRLAMEADFASAAKSLAVVAISGERGFRMRPPSGRDMAVAQELMRTMARKIRRITESIPTDKQQLQVISDVPGSARYSIAGTSPSEILADAEATYLLLLTYENLGEKVRLTADVHSYKGERVAALPLLEESVDQSELGRWLDTIAVKLCDKFAPIKPCPDNSMLNEIGRIKLRSLERTHRFTFRFGSSVYRTDTTLFLGREGGMYGEFSYAARPNVLRWGKGNGRYDGFIEATLGFEASSVAGPSLHFDGPAVAMALLSLGVTLTPWAYTSTSYNVSIGMSGGLKGFRWNLEQGMLDFNGTEPYRRSDFVFVWGFFGEMDIPMSFAPGWGVTVMSRWLPATREVTRFKNLPLQRFAATGGPTGTLGGAYLAGGIGYRY